MQQSRFDGVGVVKMTMDGPLDDPVTDALPLMPDAADLCAVMDQGAADIAAGRTVPLADVLAELDELAGRIQARLHARDG